MQQRLSDRLIPLPKEATSHAVLTRRHWLGATSALALALPPSMAWAQANAPRVAVVIGNAGYADSPLRNPARDARAMAELLASLGFQVIEERDANRARMEAALDRAAAALRGQGGVALLYFAGHGMQVDWRNFLLPVDVRLKSAADVAQQCVDVQQVIATFRAAGSRTNILVLDACRDNPLGAGGARGLAPMDAPPGTFFAYATAPGNVAEDGSEAEGNGLYTRFLLGEIRKPGARIEDIFKRVRLQVRQATQGRQIPWESTSLEDDFVFATGERLAAPSMSEREREFDTQRTEWERIRESPQPASFFAFLQRFPTGPFAELAQFSLDRLARPALVEQASQALQRVAVLSSGVDRFRVGDEWETQLTDHLARQGPRRRRARVTSIEGARVMINGGVVVFDQMGNVIVNDTGRKDPGILFVPSQLHVGKRWRSAFRNYPPDGKPHERNFYDHHVAALEDIEVPAGKFRVFRIEGHGEAIRSNGGTRLESTQWIDPQTMWTIRGMRRFRDLHRDWLLAHSTTELVAMRRVAR